LFEQPTNFDELLEKKDLKLEEILNEDGLISEIKIYEDQKLIDL
jgi:hypothetical protein